MMQATLPTSVRVRFRDELRDFLQFVMKPTLGPRLQGRRARGRVAADWLSGLSTGRLLQWALVLWAINLIFLGPIAVAAATAGGAQHRLDIHAIPWLQALLWAPVVEELVFRYGLRRIAHAFWLVPVTVFIMLTGPTVPALLLLLAVLLVCWIPGKPQGRAGNITLTKISGRAGKFWMLRVRYRGLFPWVFHGASLTFAAVHLYNFNLHQTSLWLLPLLVLPQWLAGLVLGWQRVRKGIGAAMVLHGIFNGGPLFMVWLIVRMAPDMAL